LTKVYPFFLYGCMIANKKYRIKITKHIIKETIIDVDSVADLTQAVHVAQYLATKNNRTWVDVGSEISESKCIN